MAMLCGCSSTAAKLHERQKQVVQQDENLSNAYLQGDAKHARQSLREEAQLLESATFLEASGRAQLLAKTYSRLYVLEMRTGNDVAAAADLIKLRYWWLRYGELTGESTDDAMKQMKNLTSDRIVENVDKLDKMNNAGKEPSYLKGIHKSVGIAR